MSTVATFSKAGVKASADTKLDNEIFGVKDISEQLLKTAYLSYLSRGRTNLSKTLDKGEVRGGGRKPWRQKGTGRARHGSIRSPIWVGGGVTFGPTGKENYLVRISQKARRSAVKQALTVKAQDKAVLVIESFSPTGGKTAAARKLLDKLGALKTTLVVVAAKSADVERACANLPDVKVSSASYLNVYDLLNADSVVIEKSALPVIETWLGA